MKNGVKKAESFLKRVIIATIYFILFTIFVFVIGSSLQKMTASGNMLVVIFFILSMLLGIVFLILFLYAWDNIFESEDPYQADP